MCAHHPHPASHQHGSSPAALPLQPCSPPDLAPCALSFSKVSSSGFKDHLGKLSYTTMLSISPKRRLCHWRLLTVSPTYGLLLTSLSLARRIPDGKPREKARGTHTFVCVPLAPAKKGVVIPLPVRCLLLKQTLNGVGMPSNSSHLRAIARIAPMRQIRLI